MTNILYMRTAISLSEWGYAMLISPNKNETTAHGCHYLGNMVVRMCQVTTKLV